MNTRIYRVEYYSKFLDVYNDTVSVVYVEAPDRIDRAGLEKLCRAKVPDFLRVRRFEKLEVVKLV